MLESRCPCPSRETVSGALLATTASSKRDREALRPGLGASVPILKVCVILYIIKQLTKFGHYLPGDDSGYHRTVIRWGSPITRPHLILLLITNWHLSYISRLPRWHSGREYACQCRRCRRFGFDPWVRKTSGGGNGIPLQCSCLGNPMNRGTCWAIVHGVTVRHN